MALPYEAVVHRAWRAIPPRPAACEAALPSQYMPELSPVHGKLTGFLAGGSVALRVLVDMVPLAIWGAASLAVAHIAGRHPAFWVRITICRPDFKRRFAVATVHGPAARHGMVEFLWGLSTVLTDAGLSIALAYGRTNKNRPRVLASRHPALFLETCPNSPPRPCGWFAAGARRNCPITWWVAMAPMEPSATSSYNAGGGCQKCSQRLVATEPSELTAATPDRGSFTRTF